MMENQKVQKRPAIQVRISLPDLKYGYVEGALSSKSFAIDST